MARGELTPPQPPPIKYPLPYLWRQFLDGQGWTDRRVLERQPDIEVAEAWVIYRMGDDQDLGLPPFM